MNCTYLFTHSSHKAARSGLLAFLLCLLVQYGQAQVIAFPGAEGYGKYTSGGRGGKVMLVSNLNDDGPGSFREAATARYPRIIVFSVSGTIHLNSAVVIRGDVTIAGQTAPGDGICLADYPVSLGGDNIIVRYLRFRLGDRFQNKGKVHGSGHDDAFGGNRKKHIVIDHCSMSWSTDEAFTVYDGDSTTLQWNIISEPLNYSYHFEKGDTDYENHGYGGIWGGRHLTAHHNLFAHCISRNPRFAGIRSSPEELVEFANNVIYNWGHNSVYGGEGGRYTMINNYYKYGPSTSSSVRYRIVNPTRQDQPAIYYGQFYVEGNYVDGAKDVSRNNYLGIHLDKKATDADKRAATLAKPAAALSANWQTAADAYTCVLQCAGASLPRRDAVDTRIVEEVKNRTGRIIDVQGGFTHGTSYEVSQAAWPVLTTTTAPADTDGDGMPDDWELSKGLDPNNAADAGMYTLDKLYTNIEVFINSLVSDKTSGK